MLTVDSNDYRKLVSLHDPQFSPDGDSIAVLGRTPVTDLEYEVSLTVLGRDGADRTTYELPDGGRELRWGPSDEELAFVGPSEDGDGSELWVFSLADGEATRLTDVGGAVSSPAWSPDGKTVAFIQQVSPEMRATNADCEADTVATDPDPRLIHRTVYRNEAGYFEDRRSHVYTVDLETGAVDRVTSGDVDHTCPEWGDETTLYFTRKRTYREHEIIAVDVETGATERVVESVVEADAWYPSLAATADRLAYTFGPAANRSMQQTQIGVVDRTTGEIEVPTEPLDRTVARSSSIRWGVDGERLYYLVPDEGTYALYAIDCDAGTPPEPVTETTTGTISSFDVAADRVCLVCDEWDTPCSLSTAGVGTDATGYERLLQPNQGYLDTHNLSHPEEIHFEGESGDEIQGWVLTPPDFDPDEQYPLVLEVHGGPHAMWTTSGTMWHEFQTLAANGYIVFWCNPHGSTGYGQSFMRALERDWGGIDYRDIMTGVDIVTSRRYVDENNLFVTGGSYGGYLTAWIVGHTDRFAGAVAQRGVYDLASFDGSSTCHKLIEWEFDAPAWEEPDLYWDRSPVAHVDSVRTPTRVLHGEEDYVAPINTAEMFYTFLRRTGTETEFVRYPREGHELSRGGEPAHVVDRIDRIVEWFEKHSRHR